MGGEDCNVLEGDRRAKAARGGATELEASCNVSTQCTPHEDCSARGRCSGAAECYNLNFELELSRHSVLSPRSDSGDRCRLEVRLGHGKGGGTFEE